MSKLARGVTTAVAGGLFLYTLANATLAISSESTSSGQAAAATTTQTLTVSQVMQRLADLVAQGKTPAQALEILFADAKSTAEQSVMLEAARTVFPGQLDMIANVAQSKGFDSVVVATSLAAATGAGASGSGAAGGSGDSGSTSLSSSAGGGGAAVSATRVI